MLTAEQVEYYHTNGYLGVEGVLSEQETEDLRRVTDEFIEKSREVTEHTDVFDLEPGHTSETPRLRRLKRPTAQHPVYADTLRHNGILDIVSDLIVGRGPAHLGRRMYYRVAAEVNDSHCRSS